MRVSVIIPGFNNPERWWRRSVESVMATGADEIICVDDGSKSKPLFLEDYPIRVIYRESNGGLAVARNTAMESATGDYITFVDSDDEIRPETLRQCMDALSKTSADIAIYGVNVIWPDDGMQKIDSFIAEESLGSPTPEEVLRLYRKCLLNYSCNKVYRRSFLDAHGIRFNPNGMPCEDIIFNLDCIMAGVKACTVPYVGYVYYRTHGTLLSRYKPTSNHGVHLANEKWRQYKEKTAGARAVLGSLGETSPVQELRAEWRNIWMPGTPYGIVGRWKWLMEHPEIGGFRQFVRMALFAFFRRYCYWRPIRRWNIRRAYPLAKEWMNEG